MVRGEEGMTKESIEYHWETLQESVAHLQAELEELKRQLQSLNDAEMHKRQALLMAVDAIERQRDVKPRTAELRKEAKAQRAEKERQA